MELASTAWHVISAAIVFVLGFVLAFALSGYFGVPKIRSLFLYVWHTLFSMVYLAYSLVNLADSTLYYDRSLIHEGGFENGTQFVDFFASIFTQGFGLSYLGVFLVFNIFGSVGLLAFYGSARVMVRQKSKRMKRLAWVLAILPSASFWSGALGKDAIAFMAACLFLWSTLQLRKRGLLAAFSVAAMLTVRPHISGMMVAALAGGLVVNPGLKVSIRIVLGVFSAAAAAAIIPLAIQYAGLGDASGSKDVADYFELRQSYNQEGGSGIDISGMSPPMQLATYLFRPLPFEAHSAVSFASSIENTLILVLFSASLWAIIRYRHLPVLKQFPVLILYIVPTWLILALTTANMGIAVRQKWMFLPILFFLMLGVLGRDRKPTAVRLKQGTDQ